MATIIVHIVMTVNMSIVNGIAVLMSRRIIQRIIWRIVTMFYVETHVFYKDADGIKSESVQKHPVDPALSSGKNAFDHWKMILEISKRQGKN